MYKKILLAVDPSDASAAAIQEALKLATRATNQLLVLHVIEETFAFHGGPGFDYSPMIELYRTEGQKILEDVKQQLADKTPAQIETKLIELNPFQGRIAEMIIQEAHVWGAELIIIGSHGRRGFNHLLLGSVAENTIRLATLPVLVVRGGTGKTEGQS